MASSKKRTATRELNHENWDNEEEKEDQGVFRQAGSEILQGRVIRKAKRRGVGSESGTGGTFAGFSGFKGTSHTSSSSGGLQGFDFLKGLKSSNGTTPSQETEGSKEPKEAKGDEGSKESKGDEASKEAKAPKAAVPLSELFKPKAGSWKCSVCDVSNESTSPQCVACTTPKPGGGTPSKPSVSFPPSGPANPVWSQTPQKRRPVSAAPPLSRALLLHPRNQKHLFLRSQTLFYP
ncbi:Nuclear pore complex protein Nup50like [Caligus rogercresseyi]|uniref:Nuclear pore complex protein Nup50like n=1 Tax=Caligus rogercresseyi TaxID=217165 RepID=A0A7T8KEN2_CALRO|nr:Nuclear pore complex protein Nup50like [Caligus rogercresseyi]